jgi:hypothetical protein
MLSDYLQQFGKKTKKHLMVYSYIDVFGVLDFFGGQALSIYT